MSMQTQCQTCGADTCSCVDCAFCDRRTAWDITEREAWNYGFRTGSQPESPTCFASQVCADCQRDHLTMSDGNWEDLPVLRTGHKLPWFSVPLSYPQDFSVIALLSVLGRRALRKDIHHQVPERVELECHAAHPFLYIIAGGYEKAMGFLISEDFVKFQDRPRGKRLHLTEKGNAFPHGAFQFS
jgi:hypothetical protein